MAKEDDLADLVLQLLLARRGVVEVDATDANAASEKMAVALAGDLPVIVVRGVSPGHPTWQRAVDAQGRGECDCFAAWDVKDWKGVVGLAKRYGIDDVGIVVRRRR